MSHPSPHFQSRAAFTLVEVLVAMTVMGIIFVMLGQITNMVFSTWSTSKARVDSFTQVQAMLGLIKRDIQAAVLRPDLAAFVDTSGNPACEFYSRFSGTTGSRNLSLVQYKLNTSTPTPHLQRLELGTSFATSALPYGTLGALPSLTSATDPDLVTGVVTFQIQYVRMDGTFSPGFSFDYTNPQLPANTGAIAVSISILDETSFNRAISTGQMPSLIATLTGTPPSNSTYASFWNSKMITSGGSLPRFLTGSLHIFERQILLPTQTVLQ